MGRLICSNHHESDIIQMSKILYKYYINKEKTNVIKLIFNVNDLGQFVYYFSVDDDIENIEKIKSINDFEKFFTRTSGDPGSCLKCFKSYLKFNNISIQEKKVNI
ncbi:hypothetical protein [Winogradskyella luteola]|uniref:Uncharacterized protein n=1 Tax=Winogradskyella luteola TaxID=2828330 RepID=A0A9X1F9T9_9FLAO|nr:hypothetical protein [Winogradskyella luteola]MBV7270167.1 hypothetical protein [Winogradskyella luteola]